MNTNKTLQIAPYIKSLLWLVCLLCSPALFATAEDDFQRGLQAYEQGNAEEAVEWYRKAAEQGHAEAQLSLGVMYREGSGVAKDDVLSYQWFNLAAAKGNESAREARDSLESSLTREQVTKAQARSRWKQAEQDAAMQRSFNTVRQIRGL